MMAALLVLALAGFVFWLVFFRLKLINLTPGWGLIFGFFVVHLMLVFLIGLRFGTPFSVNATVVQRTTSDDIPKFQPPLPNVPQGQYAVKIRIDHSEQSLFTIGAQGSAAIYTGGEYGAWAVLRKISIRAHSWFNWLYPINF